MIDPGKLLGGLLGGSGALGNLGNLTGLGSSGQGGLPGKAALGMGLLGVAMAAFEHFADQKAAPTPPAGPMHSAPPSFPPPTGGFSGAVPPPAPGGMPPPVPPSAFQAPAAPPAPPVQPSNQADPVLLIRAMIAAANADGLLDDTERSRILGQLEGVGLSEEEKDFLCAEFDAPRSLADIAAGASSPAVAAQLFTVSLLAVDVDTQAERDYLDGLRQALGLSDEQARAIARRLGRACA
jgi:uncharacterized membrane protein YebE (DUF533 family)